MGLKTLGLLTMLAGVLYLAAPDTLLELSDRYVLFPGRMSRGLVQAIGIVLCLLGLVMLFLRPVAR